jgi:peptide/nickel transport system substrate-binding protein
VAAFLIAGLLISASALPFGRTPPPVLRVGMPQPVTSLSPLHERTFGSMACSLVHRSVVVFEPDGRVTNDLAESVTPSADGRTVRISLKSARFHDGRPLGARDVAATLREVGPSFDEAWEGGFSRISELIVRSERELELRLSGEVPALPWILATCVVPADGDRDVGSGGYRVVPGAVFALESVSSHAFQRIELLPYASADELWKRLATNEIDVAPFLSADALEAAARYPWLRTSNAPTATGFVLRWNAGFDEAPVRRAIASVIDREELCAVTGIGTPLYTRFGESVARRPDAAAARASLASAGYRDRDGDGVLERDGRPLVIRLPIIEAFPEIGHAVRVIEQQLRTIGVGVRTVSVAATAIGGEIEGTDAQIRMARIFERAAPQERTDEVVLYRMLAHSGATRSVCGLPESQRTVLPFLDRAYPCRGVAP